MYSLKNINQIRRRLRRLLEYMSWKNVALLSVLLEARIELIYLQTSLRGFHLLLHISLHIYVDNYCIYTIQHSLFDYCWMIAAKHFPQIHYLHRSKKQEVQKNTAPTYLDRFDITNSQYLNYHSRYHCQLL